MGTGGLAEASVVVWSRNDSKRDGIFIRSLLRLTTVKHRYTFSTYLPELVSPSREICQHDGNPL